MTDTSLSSRPLPTASAWTWLRLLRVATWVTIVTSLLVMAASRFIGPSIVALAVLLGVGLALAPRRSGLALLGTLALLDLLLHIPVGAIMLSVPESPITFVLTVAALVAEAVMVVAVVAVWRGSDLSRAPSRIAAVGAGLVVLSLVFALAAFFTRVHVAPQPGDVLVVTDGRRVTPSVLETESGSVTVHISNDDPFSLRSFDIDELDVHVRIPPRSARRVSFPTSDGTFEFHDEYTYTDETSGTLVVGAG